MGVIWGANLNLISALNTDGNPDPDNVALLDVLTPLLIIMLTAILVGTEWKTMEPKIKCPKCEDIRKLIIRWHTMQVELERSLYSSDLDIAAKELEDILNG